MDPGRGTPPGGPRDDGGPPPRPVGTPSTTLRRAADPDRIEREGRPLDEAALLAPVPRPGKVVAIGRNYKDHAAEAGSEPPRVPADLLEVAQLGHRPGRRDPLGPCPGDPGRLRGGARRGHRPDRAAGLGGGRPRRTSSATPASTTCRPATSSSATASGSAASRSTRSARWARWSSRPTRSPTRRTLDIACHVNGRTLQQANTSRHVLRRRDDREPLLAGVHARAGRRHRDGHAGRRRRLPRPADPARRRRRGGRSRSRGSAGSSTPAGSTARGGPVVSDERFLVTGALGCIGAWTVRALVREGAPVTDFDLGGDPRRLARS